MISNHSRNNLTTSRIATPTATPLTPQLFSIPSWIAPLQSILRDNKLVVCIETIETIQEEYKRHGRFAQGGFVSEEAEMCIVDGFLEGVYDDDLYCITLRAMPGASKHYITHSESENLEHAIPSSTTSNLDEHPALAVAFVRDIQPEEMRAWMNPKFVDAVEKFSRIRYRLHQQKPKQYPRIEGDMLNSTIEDMQNLDLSFIGPDDKNNNKGEMVSADLYNQSVQILRFAINEVDSSSSNTKITPSSVEIDAIFTAWIKLELLAVRPQFIHNNIGKLMMAILLTYAYARHKDKAILHVAGGKSNISASNLYDRFGFQHVPETCFAKPNRNIMMLLNIGDFLKSKNIHQLLRS